MLYNFIFLVFKECFLTHSVTYPVRCLRLENHEFLGFFLCGQLYLLKGTKCNALDLTEFKNQVHYRKFLRE